MKDVPSAYPGPDTALKHVEKEVLLGMLMLSLLIFRF